MNTLVLFLIIGAAWAEIEVPTNPNSLDDLPAVQERCEKKGKTDTYSRLKVALGDTKTCIQSKIDPSTVKQELEEAKKTGSMDEVFAKYCNRREEFKDCILKTVNVTKECMEEDEIAGLNAAIKVIDDVITFACFRDGDRLAMFVAEGGMECITSRSEQVKTCLNNTLKIDTSSLTLTSFPTAIPSLKMDKDKCTMIAEVQSCVVEDLESNCKDTTPANIVDAVFKFVKRTACGNIKRKRSTHGRRSIRDIDLHAMRLINSTAIGEKLAEECRRNGGEQATVNFWETFQKAQVCLSGNRLFVTSKSDYVQTISQCSDQHISQIENCLPKQLKFYPRFVVDLIKSLVNFVYDHLNFKKLTPESEIVFCLQRLKAVGGLQKNLPSCLGNVLFNRTVDYKTLPDKITACTLLQNADTCVYEFIKKTCVPDIAVDRFLGNFTEAIRSPCKEQFIV